MVPTQYLKIKLNLHTFKIMNEGHEANQREGDGYLALQRTTRQADVTTAVPVPGPPAAAATVNNHEPAMALGGNRAPSEVSITPYDELHDAANGDTHQGVEITLDGEAAANTIEDPVGRQEDVPARPVLRTSGRLAARTPTVRAQPTVRSQTTTFKMMQCNMCGKRLQAKSALRHAREVHKRTGNITAKDVATEVNPGHQAEDQNPGPSGENPSQSEENPSQSEENPPQQAEEESEVIVEESEESDFIPEEELRGQTLFISTRFEEEKTPVQTLHTLVKREEHNTTASMEAKKKELMDFETFQVYEVVDRPKGTPLISTAWVLVDKEKDGKMVRKARLCMRGDQEDQDSQVIHTDAPTLNKINLKIMLGEAVRRNWHVSSSDVTRAFLQTSEITRSVYIKPPREAGLHHSKVWKLLKPAYGMLDAAHSFYLNFAEGLISQNMEVNRMDNAMFLMYSDKSKPGDDHRQPEGMLGAHVDDFLETGSDKMKNEVLKEIRKKFKFGSHDSLPFRYVGFNIDKDKSQKQINIDQDHFTEGIELVDMTPVTKLKKQDLLPPDFQTTFRSIVSKMNTIANTSRPDITFGVKELTMKYGKALKMDLQAANRIIKQIQRTPTTLAIPDLGNIEDWILVAFSDASTKKVDGLFDVAGHIVFLVNAKTHRSIPLTWSSRKIGRVTHSSLMAETIAVTGLIGTLFFIKQSLMQVYGKVSGNLKTLVLVDNRDLHEAVHSIKAPGEKRCTPEVFQIKQAMVLDGLITELRLVPGELQMADALTKPGRSGQNMMEAIRLGRLDVPGGLKVQRPEKLCSGTWAQIVKAQSASFGSEDVPGWN